MRKARGRRMREMRLAYAGALVALGLVLPASAHAECLGQFGATVRAFEADPTSIASARAVDEAADACVAEARAQLAEAALRSRKGEVEDAEQLALHADSILSLVADGEKQLGVADEDAEALVAVDGNGFREIRISVHHPVTIDLPFGVRIIQRPGASVALALESGHQLGILGRHPGVTTMVAGSTRACGSRILLVIHVDPSPSEWIDEFPLFPSLETGIPGPGWELEPQDAPITNL